MLFIKHSNTKILCLILNIQYRTFYSNDLSPCSIVTEFKFCYQTKMTICSIKMKNNGNLSYLGRLVIANEICCCIFSLMQLLVPVHQLLFHFRNQNLKLTKITGFVSHNIKIILDLNRLSKNLIPIRM